MTAGETLVCERRYDGSRVRPENNNLIKKNLKHFIALINSGHFFLHKNILYSTRYYCEAQFQKMVFGDLKRPLLLMNFRVQGAGLKLLRVFLSDLLIQIIRGCQSFVYDHYHYKNS